MSRTYLEGRTYLPERTERPRASPDSGRLLGLLREANEQFDLIFYRSADVSNSKRMEESFDVQRDHVALMKFKTPAA